MDTQLKRTRQLVALEAYAVTDLSGLASRIVPSVLSGLSAFKGMFTQTPAVGLAGEKNFLSAIAKRTYPTLMPLTAFVPEGLKTTYLDYAIPLTVSATHARGCVSVIDEFAVFLSMLVSNKEAVLETSSRKRYFAELMLQREKVNKDVQACFGTGTRTDSKVEEVIRRNGDWKTVFDMATDLSRQINLIERSHLNKKVDECVDLIERIQRQITEGHFEKVSPEVLLDLSDGAFQVASELEFYSVTYYRVQAFEQAITRTMAHVQKVISRDGVAA